MEKEVVSSIMKLAEKRFSFVKRSAAIGATLILFFSLLITLSHAALAATQPSVRVLRPADMQNLIFVWASGTASLQQQASHICQADSISPENCAAISADVRSAWLDLMQVDPASLGRIGVQENPTGRAQVYSLLAGKLSSLTQGQESLLLAQTQQTLQKLKDSLQALASTVETSYTIC